MINGLFCIKSYDGGAVMYEIIENPVRMTRDEIKEKFDGRWIFLANHKGTLYDFY